MTVENWPRDIEEVGRGLGKRCERLWCTVLADEFLKFDWDIDHDDTLCYGRKYRADISISREMSVGISL